jgi:hypothetical protein
MTKIVFLFTLLFTVLVCLAPAQAQGVARTFVSAAGSDSNNCTNVATPCRHFATAYAATAANGEIDVLDPANYGALTITGPVSIEGHGWATVSPPLGGTGTAIGVNGTPGGKVNIIGVVLEGYAEGIISGIVFGGGGSLTIRDCVIRNFDSGIELQTNVSVPSQIFVSNTVISNNTVGIYISAIGSGAVNAVFDHVETIDNTDGLYVVAGTPPVNITFTDSVSANNAANGIQAFEGAYNAPLSIMVRNSTIANNGTNGLEAGVDTTISVTRSTITGNGTGWLTDYGTVLSYGDNNIDGNGSANTEPPNPLPYK